MQIPHPELAGLLLAAGGSSRLGQPKQLIEIKGVTLIERAADLLLQSCGAGVCVVLGHEHERIKEALGARELNAVLNQNWAEGMAGSLRAGTRSSFSHQGCATLIMLCDQPMITTQNIEDLINLWSEDMNRPVAAGYSGIYGVPAIIPNEILDNAELTQPDSGAAALLREYSDLRVVEMPQAAVDIDTPEDLNNYKNQ